MNNNIDFINFPENVKKFNGVITHKIGLGDTQLDFKQDNEQELKIPLKYLLAYQEALYKIGNHVSGPINSEIIYLTSTLFEHFNPVKSKVECFLDKPTMEQKALNLNVEEIWNNKNNNNDTK